MIVLVLPDIAEDDALLRRARQGDRQAVGRIYERYFEPIYQFARLRLADRFAAEDIASTAFTRLILALKEGKGPRSSLRGWLFQVARNAINDHYGDRVPLPVDTLEQWLESPEPGPEMALIESLDRNQVRSAIQALSPEQQEVLLLRFDQALSLQETADVMGKNTNTIKTIQFRAVNRLRQHIQRQQMTGEGR